MLLVVSDYYKVLGFMKSRHNRTKDIETKILIIVNC